MATRFFLTTLFLLGVILAMNGQTCDEHLGQAHASVLKGDNDSAKVYYSDFLECESLKNPKDVLNALVVASVTDDAELLKKIFALLVKMQVPKKVVRKVSALKGSAYGSAFKEAISAYRIGDPEDLRNPSLKEKIDHLYFKDQSARKKILKRKRRESMRIADITTYKFLDSLMDVRLLPEALEIGVESYVNLHYLLKHVADSTMFPKIRRSVAAGTMLPFECILIEDYYNLLTNIQKVKVSGNEQYVLDLEVAMRGDYALRQLDEMKVKVKSKPGLVFTSRMMEDSKTDFYNKNRKKIGYSSLAEEAAWISNKFIIRLGLIRSVTDVM